MQMRGVLANEMWLFVDEMRPCVGKVNLSEHKEDEIYPKVEGMYLSVDEM